MDKSCVLFILVVFFTAFGGCKSERSSTPIEEIVREWIGKEIVFPQNVYCKSIDKDTICISPSTTPYKIVVYTDSIGCTSCKLHMYRWNTIIEEVDSQMADLINFQFYFHPKNIKEIFFLFRRDLFKYPVYLDVEDRLNELNKFPKDSKFQTFLLDKYNKVISVGNPADNPKIWALYKQIVKGEKVMKQLDLSNQSLLTSVKVEKEIMELENLEINKTTTVKFVLKNTGNNPLVVNNVSTTCGCTVPQWKKQPILPNETTEIVVRATPNKKGYFKKNITVYCNVEKACFILTIQGEVDNNNQ